MAVVRPARAALVVAIVAALSAASVMAGCGGGNVGAPPSPATQVPAVPAPAASTVVVPPPATSSAPPPWGTDPVTVTRDLDVPQAPVVTAVRYAGYPAEGFDRILFDTGGELPGYAVRYVEQVRAVGSDRAVPMPGRHFLLVVLSPARAHRADGDPTVSGVHPVDLPMLRGYAMAGDFQGEVTIALGLANRAAYRVGELPGRIYVDVATAPR
jgi:hypothetical protein